MPHVLDHPSYLVWSVLQQPLSIPLLVGYRTDINGTRSSFVSRMPLIGTTSVASNYRTRQFVNHSRPSLLKKQLDVPEKKRDPCTQSNLLCPLALFIATAKVPPNQLGGIMIVERLRTWQVGQARNH